uniref:Protein kinase n=1 Tax=Echinococcus granulosus TaxID=6210 RepID=A0A068WMQ7_ECHGR|nr:protein kinase [Echinococcus granulosus]
MNYSEDQRTFFEDLQQLSTAIDASTDGQASIVESDATTVKVSLRPKSGYYAHAEFLLTISCCPEYPGNSPEVFFDSPIFHPNIDPSTCSMHLSLLSDWQSCYSLSDLVKAILHLIEHPTFDSPNNPLVTLHDPAQLATKTARALAGLPVDGHRFPPNVAWCEWARANGCLPTPEQEEEEEDEWVGKMADYDQKSGSETDNFTDSAASEEEECVIELVDASTNTMSEIVPSIAIMRYSIDSEDESICQSHCHNYQYPHGLERHRVLVWHPSNAVKLDTHTVFYFIEKLGDEHHPVELGEHYKTLFTGSALRELQTHPESRQTSSACPWFASHWYSGCLHQPYASYSSSLNLVKLFVLDKPVPPAITADTSDKNLLLVENNPHGENFTCFSNDDGGSEGIGRLFDSCLLEYPDNQIRKRASSVSPQTHEEVYMAHPLMTKCLSCQRNAGLAPQWKWIFRQTRWPIRFAPQQNVNLSMTGIHIPPWRASSGRLISDICHYCAKNGAMKNLVLLDPMALSPLSPLLNLMRHHRWPKPHLIGILWMTPFDALSPFYRVPIPTREQQKENEGDEDGRGGDPYPKPVCLRFLAIAAFLTNWVSWLSRMENYAALGMSRFHSEFISAPVAAYLLQPLSLGCGQDPLLDLWPMWLFRRLLILSLRLAQLRLPFHHSSHHHLQYLFPFSDLDEI